MSSLGIKKTLPTPKTTFYYSNGTGRDGYIVSDNGGTVLKRPESAKHLLSGKYLNFDMKTVTRFRSNPKVLHYHSDGTGRDNYISDNSGGLTATIYNSATSPHFFKNSLREYRSPDFRDTQFVKADKLKLQELKERQRNKCENLSLPRFTALPFGKILSEEIEKYSREREEIKSSLQRKRPLHLN